jgi:phage-related protein
MQSHDGDISLSVSVKADKNKIQKLGNSIREAFKSSSSKQASIEMQKLDAQIKATENKLTKLNDEYRKLQQTKTPTEEYTDLETVINSISDTMEKLIAKQSRINTDTAKGKQQWQETQDKLEQYGDQLLDAQLRMDTLVQEGKAFTVGGDTEQLNATQSSIEQTTIKLEELKQKQSQLADKQKQTTKNTSKLLSVFRKLGSVGSKALKLISSAGTKTGSVIKNVFSNMKGSSDKSLKSLLKYGFGIRSLFALFNKLRGYASDAFQTLASQSPKVNKDLSAIKNSFKQLTNSIATMAQPLISALTPVITEIISLFTQAANAVASFFATLTGQKYIYKATKGNESYADSISDVANSAKEANKQLGAYDKLNVISSNNTSGSSSTTSGGGFELTTADTDVSDFANKIKEAWKKADFTEVGTIIADKINNSLKNINWDKIQQTANNFGKSFATLLNGIFEHPELWTTIGVSIGNGVNTVLSAISGFIDNFDFTAAGDSFAQSVNSIFMTVDWQELANTTADGIRGIGISIVTALNEIDWTAIFNSLSTFGNTIVSKLTLTDEEKQQVVSGVDNVISGIDTSFKTYDWGALGTMLAGYINIVFSLDWANIGKTLSDGVSGVLQLVTSLIQGMDWMQLGKDVIDTIMGIDWVGLSTQVGDLLGSAAVGVLDTLTGFIQNFNWADTLYTIGQSIMGFIEGFDFSSIISSLSTLLGSILGNAINGMITEGQIIYTAASNAISAIGSYFSQFIDSDAGFFENGKNIIFGLLRGIGKAIAGIGTWIYNNVFKPFIDGFKGAFGIQSSSSSAMSNIGGSLINGLRNGLGNIWNGIREKFTALWTDIQTWFSKKREKFVGIGSSVITHIKEGLGNVWGKIQEKFTGIVDKIKSAFSLKTIKTHFSNVVSGIKDVFSKIPDWFKDKFSNAWQKVKDVFSKGGKVFSGIKDGILSALKSVINALIGGINTIIKIPFEGINKALTKVRDISILN